MTDTCTRSRALAQEYMTNAIRTFTDAGYEAAAKNNYFEVWSCSAEDEGRLRRSLGDESLTNNGLLIHRSDFARHGIQYQAFSLRVGDVQAFAGWIEKQEASGRMWTTPVWCKPGTILPNTRNAVSNPKVRDGHDV